MGFTKKGQMSLRIFIGIVILLLIFFIVWTILKNAASRAWPG